METDLKNDHIITENFLVRMTFPSLCNWRLR